VATPAEKLLCLKITLVAIAVKKDVTCRRVSGIIILTLVINASSRRRLGLLIPHAYTVFEKKNLEHYRLSLKEEISNFNNFWYEFFWHIKILLAIK